MKSCYPPKASLEHSALAIVGGKERSGVEIHRIG